MKSEMTATMAEIKFAPGQVVYHDELGYRGVIVEVDDCYRGTSDDPTGGRGPRRQPWYHILLDGSTEIIYVSQRFLQADPSGKPVSHPLISSLFNSFENGRYTRLNH